MDGAFLGQGALGPVVLTHRPPAGQRLLLGNCLDCMVLEQLLGQWDVSISNFSNSPPRDQGLQGPQQLLVLLDNLGQPLEKIRSRSSPTATWTTIPTSLWGRAKIYQGQQGPRLYRKLV